MSAENRQMSDLSPFVGKRQYLITYAQDTIDKFQTIVNFGEAIEEDSMQGAVKSKLFTGQFSKSLIKMVAFTTTVVLGSLESKSR